MGFTSPQELSFPAGTRTNTFTFTVIDDVQNDGAGGADTLVFGLANFNNAIPGLETNFTYTIEWDESDTYVLPFLEPFDARTIGDLAGQNGWTAEDAIVTNAPAADVYRGPQAGRITTTNGYVRHTFNDGQKNVWTDVVVKPNFGEAPTGSLDGRSFAFYCNTDRYVVVYTNMTPYELTSYGPLPEDTWVRFTVESDHNEQTWDLYIDRTLVEFDLPFTDLTTPPESYEEFGVVGGGGDGAPLDDVQITLEQPPNWVYGTLFRFK